MIDGKFRGAKWIGLAALLLLAACGGGNSGQDGDLVVRQPTAPQTMHKPVTQLTCFEDEGLEGTTFAADLQAIHAASLIPEKIYCKLNKNEYGELPAICGNEITWFHIFLDVPPDQIDKAKALGYTKFAPPAEAKYEDFLCLN